MTRTSPTYGRRGRLDSANTGVRHTASTYGKAKFGTYSEKASGHIIVESDAERLVAHLLTLDPRVRAFQPQPFCVDLRNKCLLFSKQAINESWFKHHQLPGPKFYTPDFSIDWQDGLHHAVEVKTERFEGDESYLEKLELARPILAANGHPLRRIVVPGDSRHPIRLNAKVLKRAGHLADTYLTAELVERVTRCCERGPVTLSTLCTEAHILPGVVPILLVRGVLEGDLARQPIRDTLVLSLAHGSLDHLRLIEELENDAHPARK